jgi:hypothetical protein
VCIPATLMPGCFLTFLLCKCAVFIKYLDLACKLTPTSRNRVLLEKLTGFSASQKIPHILWNPNVH